ncbi:uncharacterized protein LOC109861810 [Pseudomyrmex gracilis]|uniref:uncharacterized protein LOC109861810 n=1 Tax=Pseudomyrmex gracilis TaxID=219809 RepID=UPI000994FD72|nr:uncharacterized protein LOC109861810 [Pseudomyrmex gracilis]
MSNKTFQSHFRMSRKTCYKITEKFERSTFYPSDRSHGRTPISSAEKHVLLFLWFAGNKCSLRELGDRLDVSISTCECVLQKVMDFLYNISKEIITFPLTLEEKCAVAENFKNIFGFDGVIGCIDGSVTRRSTASICELIASNDRTTCCSIASAGL